MAKAKKSTQAATKKPTQVAVTKYEKMLEGPEHAGELRKVAEAAGVPWREVCRQALNYFCAQVAAGQVEVRIQD